MKTIVDKKYQDVAYRYAKEVLEGKRRVSAKVYKACKRHMRDLENIPNSDYDYFPDMAKNPIDFIEILPDVKTGKPYPLAEFQNSSSLVCMAGEEIRQHNQTIQKSNDLTGS